MTSKTRNPKEHSPEDFSTTFIRKLSSVATSGGPDWEAILAYLNGHADAFPLLKALGKKSNIPPGILLVFFGVGALVVFATGVGSKVVCDLVGFWYPAYKSYKVLKCANLDTPSEIPNGTSETETPKKTAASRLDTEQLVFWVKYWIVFSLGFVFHYITSLLLFWVPFLNFFKLLVILALFHPRIRGAETIFNVVVSPVLLQYEVQIDSAVSTIETAASKAITKYTVDRISDKLSQFVKKN